MPKITVLMPVYNAERYVGEAIESILRQTFADFEFLILNDGSTDGSAAILRQYAQSDQRIRFYDFTENAGLIARLNQGIDLAQGEYLARMDADDLSLPERFAKQVQYLDDHPRVAIVGSFAKLIDQAGVLKGTMLRWDIPDHWLQTHLFWGNPFIHPSIMGRTRVFREFRYHEEYYLAEDYFLWSQIAFTHPVSNFPEPLLLYRVHDGSISLQKFEQQEKTVKNIFHFHLEQLLQKPISQESLERHYRIIRNTENAATLSLQEKQRLLHWLNHLAKANQRRQIYDQMFFQKRLRKYWNRYFDPETLAQLGVHAMPLVFSPLCLIPRKEKFFYLLKCLKQAFYYSIIQNC